MRKYTLKATLTTEFSEEADTLWGFSEVIDDMKLHGAGDNAIKTFLLELLYENINAVLEEGMWKLEWKELTPRPQRDDETRRM